MFNQAGRSRKQALARHTTNHCHIQRQQQAKINQASKEEEAGSTRSLAIRYLLLPIGSNNNNNNNNRQRSRRLRGLCRSDRHHPWVAATRPTLRGKGTRSAAEPTWRYYPSSNYCCWNERKDPIFRSFVDEVHRPIRPHNDVFRKQQMRWCRPVHFFFPGNNTSLHFILSIQAMQ